MQTVREKLRQRTVPCLTAKELLLRDKYQYLLELEDLELNGPDLRCYQVGTTIIIFEQVAGESHIQIVPGQGDCLRELCRLLKRLVHDKGWLTLFQPQLLDCDEFQKAFAVIEKQKQRSYLYSAGDGSAATVDQNVKRLGMADAGLVSKFECEEKLPYGRYSLRQIFDLFVGENQGVIFAYVLDNQIVGYLTAVPSFDDVWDTDFVYVLPEYRGRNIGTELARAYAGDRCSQGFRAYWSNAFNEYSEAIAVKAGFHLVRETILVKIQRKTKPVSAC